MKKHPIEVPPIGGNSKMVEDNLLVRFKPGLNVPISQGREIKADLKDLAKKRREEEINPTDGWETRWKTVYKNRQDFDQSTAIH